MQNIYSTEVALDREDAGMLMEWSRDQITIGETVQLREEPCTRLFE